MRIISGEYGGRMIKAVPGSATRPTTDKIKEAIFNLIGPYFDGGRSLDLYAGSGGLSIEGVSRGIEQAVLVDRQFAAIKIIKENVAVTKEEGKFNILKSSAEQAIQRLSGQKPFDLFYFDPPYAKQTIQADVAKLSENGLIAKEAILMAETDQEANLPEEIGNFKLWKQREYGITVITIYRFEE